MSSSTYIRTTTNYVSRKAQIEGPQNVEMRGRVSQSFLLLLFPFIRAHTSPITLQSIIAEGVTMRGDLAPIRVGHYCFFEEGCVLSPCVATVREGGTAAHIPLTIGSMTLVGKDAVVEAAYLGSHVEIGGNSVVGARCILKDCCRLLPDTVLPPDTVVPPFALVAGQPGRVVGELPPSVPVMTRQAAMGRYRRTKKEIVESGEKEKQQQKK